MKGVGRGGGGGGLAGSVEHGYIHGKEARVYAVYHTGYGGYINIHKQWVDMTLTDNGHQGDSDMEREREDERQTERQTGRETDRQRDRDRERALDMDANSYMVHNMDPKLIPRSNKHTAKVP